MSLAVQSDTWQELPLESDLATLARVWVPFHPRQLELGDIASWHKLRHDGFPVEDGKDQMLGANWIADAPILFD